MEPNVKVSVIVPVFNNVQYLRQCFESLINQTLQDIEIILVDDGSTEQEASQICEEYKNKSEKVKVLHTENRGAGAAINTGIAMSSGEYIGQVDCDDFCEPCMYEELYREASENSAELVRCNYFNHRDAGDTKVRMFEYYELVGKERSEKENYLLFSLNNALWNGLYKKSFLDEFGIRMSETPGAAFQDTGFSMKTRALSRATLLYPACLYHYRIDNEASASKPKNIKHPELLLYEFCQAERAMKKFNVTGMWSMFAQCKMMTCIWMLKQLPPEEKAEWKKRMAIEMEGETFE